MSKYIDADELKRSYAPLEGCLDVRTLDGAKNIFDAFVDLMPAADVAEVVRCKDCIYHTGDDECANGRWDNWSNSDYGLYPEALEMDYCSYGERKDG